MFQKMQWILHLKVMLSCEEKGFVFCCTAQCDDVLLCVSYMQLTTGFSIHTHLESCPLSHQSHMHTPSPLFLESLSHLESEISPVCSTLPTNFIVALRLTLTVTLICAFLGWQHNNDFHAAPFHRRVALGCTAMIKFMYTTGRKCTLCPCHLAAEGQEHCHCEKANH